MSSLLWKSSRRPPQTQAKNFLRQSWVSVVAFVQGDLLAKDQNSTVRVIHETNMILSILCMPFDATAGLSGKHEQADLTSTLTEDFGSVLAASFFQIL